MKSTRSASLTRERLLRAALEAFSTAGFDGVSVRNVERMAGVDRGLAAYYFGSKLSLWNEAVDSVFDAYLTELTELRDALRDVSPRERGRALTMAYVRFNSAHPEFYRLLVLEGTTGSERSQRLGAHLSRAVQVFREMFGLSAEAVNDDLATTIVLYIVLGSAGAPFAMPAYAEHLGGAVGGSEFVERFAEAIAWLALNGTRELGVGGPASAERGATSS